MRRQGYQGRDGLTRSAPTTFDSKRSAEPRLTLMERRILRGEWQPPEQSKIMFCGYATHWVGGARALAAAPCSAGMPYSRQSCNRAETMASSSHDDLPLDEAVGARGCPRYGRRPVRMLISVTTL